MNKIKKANKPDLTPDKAKGKKIKSAQKKTIKAKTKSKRVMASKRVKPRKISIKYKESARYTKFASKSQIEKHIVDGKIVFSKAMQKQYNLLNKRFGISKSEYLKLYYGVRKANAKGARLAKEDSLYHVKYSTKFNWVTSREDFEKLMRSVGKVLSRDYKERRNKEFKNRFMHNIEIILRDDAAKRINDIVKQMSAAQLKQFIDENPDLEKVMYESDPERFTSFDKEATSMIEARLRDFLGGAIEIKEPEIIDSLPF